MAEDSVQASCAIGGGREAGAQLCLATRMGDAEIGHTLVPHPKEYTDSQPVLLKEHAECVIFCSG